MTYEEWKEEKRKQDNAEPPAPKPEPKPEPKTEDKPTEVEVLAPTVEKPDAVDEPIPQREEFKPASTIEEAEQYASRLATDVSYRGLTVDSANAINQTLTELTQLYPTKPLKELKTNNRLKRAAARANFQQIEINPNAQKESTEEIRNILTERLKEYKKARETASYKMQKQYDKAIKQIEESLRYERFSVSSDLGRQVTIIHEYGHVVADQYFGQINSMLANPNRYSEDGVKMNKLVQDAYNKAKNSDDKYKISEYALSDKEEFFAECFAMYHLKQELPDYIEDMMKEVLKRGAV
jgi:vacuolar-type H+-ATPase subunit I/STV1